MRSFAENYGRSGGFTLFELTVVVAIVALVALVAAPTREGVNEARVGEAAAEVAYALRYARDRSISEAAVYAAEIDTAGDRVRVLRIDTSVSPAAPVYDVRHPLSKWLWDIDLDDHAPAQGVDVTATATWLNPCATPSPFAVFASGEVVSCVAPLTARLDTATWTLTRGDASTTVTLDGLTGRVITP